MTKKFPSAPLQYFRCEFFCDIYVKMLCRGAEVCRGTEVSASWSYTEYSFVGLFCKRALQKRPIFTSAVCRGLQKCAEVQRYQLLGHTYVNTHM